MKEGPSDWQSGADLKPPQAAIAKAMVVNVAETSTRFQQARSREASASEPLQCRNGGSLHAMARAVSIERFSCGICERLGVKFPGPTRHFRPGVFGHPAI